MCFKIARTARRGYAMLLPVIYSSSFNFISFSNDGEGVIEGEVIEAWISNIKNIPDWWKLMLSGMHSVFYCLEVKGWLFLCPEVGRNFE